MMSKEEVSLIFTQNYGEGEHIVSYAPGRVNLIGDHTDYNDGFVLPAAINFGTFVAARGRQDCVVTVTAHDLNNERVSFELTDIYVDEVNTWSNYVRGTLLCLKECFSDIRGADLLVCGDIPTGAGLSSSASFEMALLKAFCELFRLPLSGIEAAKIGQRCENDFVGCNCGIMDQLISAQGKKGHAMLLDCKDLQTSYVRLPDEIAILIVNSNVKRGLVDSEYNTRRQQCEAVAAQFGKASLRELSLAELEDGAKLIDEQAYRRAKHVLTENVRTVQALTALSDGDLVLLSHLMQQSHHSLRDDFEVTTKEIDALVELLSRFLGTRGGVRMTGGGFGGCVVAIMPLSLIDQAKQAVLEYYPIQTGLKPEVYICTAEDGAFTTS